MDLFINSYSTARLVFDIVLTTLRLRQNNVDTTLYQRCATLFRRCFNVGLHRCIKVGKPRSDFVSFSTSDQRYFNVISTLIHKVETTLIRR